ncbi:hypothetical protein EBB07_33665 [Paenibacillaceae bacterium]|nr:hypothetical protein EBB07_33665 [Paenibacillaceae bacterium]
MSSNRIKMIGDRYGRLTVILELERRNNFRYFLCKCDCGEEHTVKMGALRNGSIKSCGCLRDERAKTLRAPDLTNTRFDRLVAIETVGRAKGNKTFLWRCICDCKNEVIVRGDFLKGKGVKSCGCLKKEQDHQNLILEIQKRYIEGVKVPSLRAKTRKDNSSGHKGVYWAKRERKWVASIGIKGKSVYLGYFADKQDAIRARKEAEEKYHQPYIDKLMEGNGNEHYN